MYGSNIGVSGQRPLSTAGQPHVIPGQGRNQEIRGSVAALQAVGINVVGTETLVSGSLPVPGTEVRQRRQSPENRIVLVKGDTRQAGDGQDVVRGLGQATIGETPLSQQNNGGFTGTALRVHSQSGSPILRCPPSTLRQLP